MSQSFRRSTLAVSAALAVSLVTGPALWAIDVPEGPSQIQMGTAPFETAGLKVEPSLEIHALGFAKAAGLPGMDRFLAAQGDQWEVRLDRRNNLPALIQGSGVPLLPGKGNKLTNAQVGLRAQATVDDAERAVRGFLEKYPDVLGLAGYDLRLDRAASIGYGGYFWNIQLQQFVDGVPVKDAFAYFRINNGNLVQFGVNRIADVQIDTRAALTADESFAAAVENIGLQGGVAERRSATLEILPIAAEGDQSYGETYEGLKGAGYSHVLAYTHVFAPASAPDQPLRVVVDARSGQVLEVRSEVVFATVKANVYPTTNSDPLVSVGLPFVNVTNGSTKTTDASGNYTYGSGTATSTLNGKYIKMADQCGAISLSASSPGNLDFGGASGTTNCTTPGFGGAGNTHSSRTGHYHLTKINRKAATFFPTNTWLSGVLTANMNINSTCNAYWNGTTVNFYRSGGGCSNTGEIAAVFLHEWGHGMDAKSGGAASDAGSGEAVGDTFAFLETKDACIGKNFRPGVACTNCNSSCTGVRDLAAFASGGISVISKPANVTNNSGINCDRYACPYTGYAGPMGYEGHCESYIASSANWDLSKTLVTKYGSTAGWTAMDKIWYGSLTPSKSAYRLVSGGTCNAAASVDGCGSTNWYTVFLPADDDDGNLANGTPNACRIWDAFSAHGIACGTRPTCTTP